MLHRLFFRLFLAFWLLSAAILFFSGWNLQRTLQSEFTEFITEAEAEERRNLTEAVSDILEDEPERIQPALNHLARTQNLRLILKDHDGNLIHDTERHRRRGEMEEVGAEDPMLGESTHPLIIQGTREGELTIIPLDRSPEAGYFTPEEMDFHSQVRNSIWWGGLISLFLSALVSGAVSLSVSRPLENLKQAAEALKQGSLESRASCKGPQEIRELSKSFNSMAERLQKTDHLKKKLTQDISHELRNPVSSLKGYMEAFQDGILTVNQEHLDNALQELNRLDNLVEEIHQLALVDIKEGAPAQETIDLKEMGDKINLAVKPILQAKKIYFNYHPPAPGLSIKGNPARLEAAIKNLISNAVKHTNEGGTVDLYLNREEPVIEDKYVSNPDAVPRAVIRVSDNGKGISQEKLPYIFERFYRADESRSRETGGSGLGLALVMEWTKEMGGEIEVASQEGEGSTFTLKFPLE